MVWTFYSSSNSFEPVVTVTPSRMEIDSRFCVIKKVQNLGNERRYIYIYIFKQPLQGLRPLWYFLLCGNTDTIFFPKFTELNVVVPQRGTNIAVRNQQKCLCLGWHNLKKRRQFSNPNHSFLGPSRSFKCSVTQKVYFLKNFISALYHWQNKEPFRSNSL